MIENIICKVNWVVCFIGLYSFSMAAADSKTAEEMANDSMRDLAAASEWFVTEGVAYYYRNEEHAAAVQKKVRKEFIVGSHAGPDIDNGRPSVRYILTAGAMNNEILVFHTEQRDEFFEFWIVMEFGPENMKPHSSCRFYVTKASDHKSLRTILSVSDKYHQIYKLEDGRELRFPEDDLEMVHYMAPWLYPRCYDEPKLTNYKIVIAANGKYKRKKMNWFERREQKSF